MRILSIILLLLGTFLLSTQATFNELTREIPTPLLIWSGRTSLVLPTPLPPQASVVTTLTSLFTTPANVPPLLATNSPRLELVLLYLSPFSTLAFSESKSFVNVQTSIRESSSSVVWPYYYANPEDETTLDSLISVHASIVVTSDRDATAMNYLQQHPEIFKNGKTELIVVKLQKDEEITSLDRVIADLQSYVSINTKNYVAVLASTSTAYSHAYLGKEVNTEEDQIPIMNLRDTSTTSPPPTTSNPNGVIYNTYFPPFIAEGIMVSVVLLVILAIGGRKLS